MFCSEEELFIKIRFTDSYSEVLLVFDMKQDVFYFQENFFPSRHDCKEQQLFAACRDGKVYGLVTINQRSPG